MKNRYGYIITCVLLIAALVGCGQKGGSAGQAPEKHRGIPQE
jgi:hypothetical protein